MPVLAGVGGLVAVLHLSAGRAVARAGWRGLRRFALIAAAIGGWHLWVSGPDMAARVVLQLLIAVAAAGLVTMTTRLEDMIALFQRILAALGLPEALRRRIALAMALAIRFVPVLGQRGAGLIEAWRARSPRRASPRLVLPLAILAIDEAEEVAEALRARSAGAQPPGRPAPDRER
ncbi:MAG: energy-coupling factor transporter transmembrane protein EcfT [Rubellimicrobium sp.]|nr:energy-coupling factor transporter transmembrane protein EcfT [Rubellimicrobium sp.]